MGWPFLSSLSWSDHYVSCCGYLLGGPGSLPEYRNPAWLATTPSGSRVSVIPVNLWWHLRWKVLLFFVETEALAFVTWYVPANALDLENESQRASSIHNSSPHPQASWNSFLQLLSGTRTSLCLLSSAKFFQCPFSWLRHCLASAGGLEASPKAVAGLVLADLLIARIPQRALKFIHHVFPLAGSFNLHGAGRGGDITCLRTHGHLTKLSLSVVEPCAG